MPGTRKDLERSALMMNKIKNPLKGGPPKKTNKTKDYLLTGITVDAEVDVQPGIKNNFKPTTVKPDSPNPGIESDNYPAKKAVSFYEYGGKDREEKQQSIIDMQKAKQGGLPNARNIKFKEELAKRAKKII